MDPFKGEYVPEQAPVFKGNYVRTLEELEAWQALADEPVLEPDLPIVDAHHHLQEDHHGRYLLHEFLADMNSGHNIVSTVHVQARSMHRADGPEAFKPLGETEFARGIAAMSASGKYGRARICEAIVGHVDLTLGEIAGEVLDAHIEAAGGRFRGIRHIAPHAEGELGASMPLQAPKGLLVDPAFRKGYAALGPRGLSFEAWLFHPQLADVVDLARAFPDTTVVLNHLGGRLGIGQYAHRFAQEFDAWRRSLDTLAALPNVVVKVGGLGMLYGGFAFHTRDTAPSSEMLANAWGPFIRAGIDAFGPSRAMMESNFPVDKQSASYKVLWNALKRAAAGYGREERSQLFHGTAQRVYRLQPVT